MSDPKITVTRADPFTEVSTLIEPTLNPGEVTSVLLTYVPELAGYSLTQMEPGSPPDVVVLTREMAERIASFITTGVLPSSPERLSHVH